MTARSITLFAAAAFAEIGGAYLVWVGIKDDKGVVFVALGAMALTALVRARPLAPPAAAGFGRLASCR